VAKDGSGAFTNIQSAINAAPANAVVHVGPGVFAESLVIDKPLTLEGAGWQKTVIRKGLDMEAASEPALLAALGPKLPKALSEAERRDLVDEWMTLSETLRSQLHTWKAERRAVVEDWLRRRAQPVLLVRNASNVVVRGCKFTYPRACLPGGGFPQEALVSFTNAQAVFQDCAVVGGCGLGVLLGKGADVEVRQCLVAGIWGNGIAVGDRYGRAARAWISGCDVRNCYHVSIFMGAANQAATIQGCRLSGSAWHGIRYGDGSSLIVSNVIYGHGRCGIFASGRSEATVRGNLFYRNETAGVWCVYESGDLIEGNTFAHNRGGGVAVYEAAAPVLRRNIFYGSPRAIFQSVLTSPGGEPAEALLVERNVFWSNATNWARLTETREANHLAQVEIVPLEDATHNLLVDPRFKNTAQRDFRLAPDSLARQDRVGVFEPLSFASPWPVQPEEKAIIPQPGTTRDSRQWKPPRPKTPRD
jgi:hypothetical protein